MTEDDFRNMNEGRFGMFGESLWSGIIRGCGLGYQSLCRIAEGGAPLQRHQGGNLILPDFRMSSNRFLYYLDSKAKRRPVVFRVAGNEERHGIYYRNWQHYQEIQGFERTHCLIAVFEAFKDEKLSQWSGALLLESLAKLGEPFRGFSTMADTVFWPRARLSQIGSVSPSRAVEICNQAQRPEQLAAIKESLWELLGLRAQDTVQGYLF